MTHLAPVDELRALPPSLARAVFADLARDLGPGVAAALRFKFDFWARPAQRLPDPDGDWAVCVISGEYGTGKTWLAVQLFLREILSGRAQRPRIICATGPAIEGTVIDGPSGIRRWLPPHIRCEFMPSKGHEGVLWIGDVKVSCLSADAPGQAIGEGSDLDLRDDVAKWVISCGAEGAQNAWAAASKSCREGDGRAIVPTTPDGVEFIRALVSGERRGVVRIDLGKVESNATNLARNFVEHVVTDLRAAGLWQALGGASPFAKMRFEEHRLDVCPPLVEFCVAIDPALSDGPRACEVGIVGGGRDERSTIHVRHDRSAVLDAGRDGWPAAAWDLAEELQHDYPGVSWHFLVETNRGRNPPAVLLRGEERVRRLRRGLPEVSVCEIREVRSDKNKCERATSPARLMVQGQVKLAPGLSVLEGQLRTLTPDGTSSDRADAMVHLVNDQAGLDEKSAKKAAEEQTEAEAQAQQCEEVAAMNAALAARKGGAKPPDPGPMKVEGAPPGDARYAGPPPRHFRPAQSWRTRSVL